MATHNFKMVPGGYPKYTSRNDNTGWFIPKGRPDIIEVSATSVKLVFETNAPLVANTTANLLTVDINPAVDTVAIINLDASTSNPAANTSAISDALNAVYTTSNITL